MKSYFRYGLIATGDSDALSPQGLIWNRKLANESITPTKLLWRMQINQPGIKDKPFDFLKRKKREHEGQKRLLRATTSTNIDVLRTSYLVAHRIPKANKAFAIGKELIRPA